MGLATVVMLPINCLANSPGNVVPVVDKYPTDKRASLCLDKKSIFDQFDERYKACILQTGTWLSFQ